MTATPDPKIVREIARKFLTDPDVSADELDYVVRSYIGYVGGAEHTAWRDAVRADAEDATVTTTASWPDEQAQDEREPPRLFTDIDRDTTPYLRVRAFITAATQMPDTNGMGIASVIDGAGVIHVLTEQDVEDVLDDHGEMQNEVDRLIGEAAKGQPQDERDGDVLAGFVAIWHDTAQVQHEVDEIRCQACRAYMAGPLKTVTTLADLAALAGRHECLPRMDVALDARDAKGSG